MCMQGGEAEGHTGGLEPHTLLLRFVHLTICSGGAVGIFLLLLLTVKLSRELSSHFKNVLLGRCYDRAEKV
jgi:hypothetical protein